MSLCLLAPIEISANAAAAQYWAAEAAGIGGAFEIWNVIIKIKTHTPGAAQLLVTLQYDDEEGPQQCNAALSLVAGSYIVTPFTSLWRSNAVNVTLAFQFLGAVGNPAIDGTADVTVLVQV